MVYLCRLKTSSPLKILLTRIIFIRVHNDPQNEIHTQNSYYNDFISKLCICSPYFFWKYKCHTLLLWQILRVESFDRWPFWLDLPYWQRPFWLDLLYYHLLIATSPKSPKMVEVAGQFKAWEQIKKPNSFQVFFVF